jgi:hypothetical protein
MARDILTEKQLDLSQPITIDGMHMLVLELSK